MKNFCKKFSLAILVLMISSCAIALPPQGAGGLYTESRDVVYYDPYIKPDQKITFCSRNYLGLISYGNSSFDALKLNSDIRKIATIERTYSSRFLVYSESCLIVKGE